MKLEHRSDTVQLACGQNEVKTTEGMIRGIKDGNEYIFRGIRYAQAKRVQAAARLSSYEGVREAISFGPACPEYSTPLPAYECNDHPYYLMHSEDCLYLNLRTGHLDSDTLRPVVVFFADRDFQTAQDVATLERQAKELTQISSAVLGSPMKAPEMQACWIGRSLWSGSGKMLRFLVAMEKICRFALCLRQTLP